MCLLGTVANTDMVYNADEMANTGTVILQSQNNLLSVPKGAKVHTLLGKWLK
jgi:hypothetical protein